MNIPAFYRLLTIFKPYIYSLFNIQYWSIVDLQGRIGVDGEKIYIDSYYAKGLYATSQRGGWRLVYKSSQAKTGHNGITIHSPTVPWNGTQAALAAYFEKTGETDPSGVGCWVLESGELDLMKAGAVADGIENDTASIKYALNHIFSRKLSLKVPTGTYLYDGSGELGTGCILYGDGRRASVIKSRLANPTDDYLIRAINPGSGVRSIGFEANTTQTGGSYVWLSGNNSFIEDFYMDGDFNGILMSANGGRIRHGRMQNGAAGSIRIRAEGGDNSQIIDDVLIGAQTPEIAAAGIRVRNSSALMITNTSVLKQNIGLLIDPYSSTTGTSTTNTDSGGVFSLWATNCFFDTNALHGVYINPTGNATVARIHFTRTWASSCGDIGFKVKNDSSGTVAGLHLTDHEAILNGKSGLSVDGTGTVTDVSLIGGNYGQNGEHGVDIIRAVTGLSITSGAQLGAGDGVLGNTLYGLNIQSSSTDHVVVVGNRMSGNGAGPVNEAISGTKHFANNVGFKTANTGNSSIPIGSSSVVVNHGLGSTPSTSEIIISPTNNWGNSGAGIPYVDTSTITSTQFTVKCTGNATANIFFVWRASCSGNK